MPTMALREETSGGASWRCADWLPAHDGFNNTYGGAAGRSRVTPKKNFNPQIAAFSDAGDDPWSTRCNW
jgi:hypothetical protein